MNQLTAVIITKNEEDNIYECINSVSFCDEIIIIDDNSGDRTQQIAKKLGVIVYQRSSNGDFSSQRNFGLEKAKADWVLFIDADERVSKDLAEEIYQQTSQFLTSATGFNLKRHDILWGRTMLHGDSGSQSFLRLARRMKGNWVGKVHERWEIIGEVKSLANPLYHYPHSSVSSFLEKINYYSTIRADELLSNKKKVSFFSIIVFPAGKFLQDYFIKQGFRDGTAGVVQALMMSFHSFLVRGKLWQFRNVK